MTEQELSLEHLQQSKGAKIADEVLWKAIVAFQGDLFYTASGLPFWYTLKKSGSGELMVSRKEGSKTLTRSSILYAFHIVREAYFTEASVMDIRNETQPLPESDDVSGQSERPHTDRRRRRHAKEAPEWMLWQDTQAVLAEDRVDIPAYCGPKEIGQIFGISYIYSMFFRFGLIRIPRRVAEKMTGGEAC